MTFKNTPQPLRLGRYLYSFVFLPGGDATPDVAFLLVQVEDPADLLIQCFITLGEPLLQVLVDGGFGDMKVFGGGADGSAGLNDVHSQLAGSLLYGIGHVYPSDAVCCPEKTMRQNCRVCVLDRCCRGG